MKNHIVLFLFSILIVLSFNHTYAQSDENDDNMINDIIDEKTFSNNLIYLWVPEKMIKGEIYEGVIVLDKSSNESKLALISSSNDDVVKVDDSALVDSHNNHGIFQITPIDEGTAEIFVSINGELSSQSVQVYSQKSGVQSLALFLPTNSTKADLMSVYVFTLDGNAAPTPTKNNISVKITSTNGIDTIQEVTIQKDSFYTNFIATVRGSGSISVSSEGIISDTRDIEKVTENIDVKLAVAPNIIAKNSFAYYYVWLEKDGKPFNIPTVINVILHSANPEIVRLTAIPPQYQNDNIINIPMRDGIGKGMIYTGKVGYTTLTASISQYGSASSEVFVGPAIMGTQDIQTDEKMTLEEFNAKYGRNEFIPDSPNSALLWIYPNITSQKAFGVAALYFANSTETINITLDDNESQISSVVEKTTLYPMITDGRIVTVSSNSGLSHDSVYEMSEHGLRTHAIEFEIVGKNNGIYDVELSGTGIKKTKTRVEIKAPDDDEYHLNITPLPTQTLIPQDLAIISVIDSDGNLIDIKNTFGQNMKINLSATSSKLSNDETIIGNGNIGKVKGMLTGTSTLSITSQELGLENETVNPAGIATSLELLIPQTVHTGEKFPYIIHEMDSFGVPLKKTIAGFSSSLGIESINDTYLILNIEGKEKITTLSNIGASQKEIESFLNPMDMIVSSDRSQVRVGEDIKVQIINFVSDVIYTISSPFPYEQISNNEFIVTPNSEIKNAEIAVFASKDGYVSKTDTLLISSEYIVELSINAVGINDEKLAIPYSIEGMEQKEGQTPYNHKIKPKQVTITFPQTHSLPSGGYEFQNVLVNDKTQNKNIVSMYADKDYIINANYQKQIQIIVNDGKGSGVYPYNSTVIISAPEKYKLSFLIRDVFDHWEGTSQQTNSFTITAIDDLTITAVYRDDYSYLMMIIITGISIPTIMILRKGNSGYSYKIKEITDLVLDIIKKLTSVKSIKTRTNKKKKSN